MSDQKCPICSLIVEETGRGGSADFHDYKCPVCGPFTITRTALHNLRSKTLTEKKSAVLSHAIRRMQKQDSWPEINSKILDVIMENNYLPSPAEQADNLILWIGDNVEVPGVEIGVDPDLHKAIIGAVNNHNFHFIVSSLVEQGLVLSKSEMVKRPVTLSFRGWQRYELIKKGALDSRKAFMAMPYGNDLIDKVYRDYFKKAVEQTGFNLFRIDEKPKAGSIDDRLRVEIRTSKFLIAELTEGNHGAYWEAGFAEGLGKPVIYTCESTYFKNKGTHFDTNHLHTVLWEREGLEDAAERLKITIRATLPEDAKLKDD
ncbi:MAG TPA: hypothetical protein PLG94_06535 [Smithellaceae bacterium]|nr:hypothetical protein [Smithellaceae bacterium]